MRGVRKTLIFIDDTDRRTFLKILAVAIERYACLCFTYCLMGNHYHLVIQSPRNNISCFMQYIGGRYGRYFNRRHGYTGHVYEGRFDSPVIEGGPHLGNAIAYVARNPVKAKLVKNAADWKWSSYRAIAGMCACPKFLTVDWLGDVFPAKDIAASRRLFSTAVHTDDDQIELEDALVHGSIEFRKHAREVIGATLYQARLPRCLRAVARPPLPELFAGIKKPERRHRIIRAHVVHGYLLTEIARYLELHPTTISRILNRAGSYRDVV
jgi:REP element-mobilizing transposase RayT